MRSILLAVLAVVGCTQARAQNAPLPDQDRQLLQKTNDVTVVLDDPPHVSEPPSTPPANQSEQPVLVTGHPPVEALLPAPEKEPAPKPETGVTVSVEKLQIHSKKIDPAKVTLYAPFPAKPLADPPPGWKLDVNAEAKPFHKEVEIATGSKITLSIRPLVLVPIADGTTTFNVNEPGFEPERQYQQIGTVGAILTDSVESLDAQARQLGDAIDRIQQLLVSLPPTETPPAPIPPKAEPVRKR